jgi:hypothetical protein
MPKLIIIVDPITNYNNNALTTQQHNNTITQQHNNTTTQPHYNHVSMTQIMNRMDVIERNLDIILHLDLIWSLSKYFPRIKKKIDLKVWT